MFTPVYDTYWNFACERQRIFFKRLTNSNFPLTTDQILNKYRFTNAYRASDRVSQYLIKKVIYTGNFDNRDKLFRILLFKLFNSIETWEELKSACGEISWRNYRFSDYDRVLTSSLASKKKIYSSAYIMPSGKSTFGSDKKHQNNLMLLEFMFRDQLPEKVEGVRALKDLYYQLLAYPTIGPFLAYQYAIDINYSELTNFSESEFTVPGPGALGGISKCFSKEVYKDKADYIKHMYENQEEEFSKRDLNFQTLWGRPLQLIDLQNLFCEVDKYSRVHHPELTGDSNRKRIKRKFSPNMNPIQYFFPPKWGLNHLLNESNG